MSEYQNLFKYRKVNTKKMNQTRQIKFLGKVNTNVIKKSDSGSVSNESIMQYDSQRIHFKVNKKRTGKSFDAQN